MKANHRAVRQSGPFTVPEVARRNRVGTRTVYKAIKRNELQAARINGRDWRVLPEWERAWLERQANVAIAT
jgi:excisionase family DNA binding protein